MVKFIFVQEKLSNHDKEKEIKVNGIKIFVYRTIQNDIIRNIDFIKTNDGKLGTNSICKYSTTRARHSDCSRSETIIRGR